MFNHPGACNLLRYHVKGPGFPEARCTLFCAKRGCRYHSQVTCYTTVLLYNLHQHSVLHQITAVHLMHCYKTLP